MKKTMEPDCRFTLVRESFVTFIPRRLSVLLALGVAVWGGPVAAAPSANLDQGRNGPASGPIIPVEWVNGNLNASQSHYLEGYAIPYRLVMTDLPTDGTEIVLTLGYDATHGGKHALDFLTDYTCMDFPLHSTYFGHGPESVSPTVGIPLVGTDPAGLDDAVTDTTGIAVPPGTGTVLYAPTQPADGFADNPCGKVITIIGGQFSSESGPEFAYTDNAGVPQAADLAADQAEQLFTVRFKATSKTVVLAWGGHIASLYDWGYDAVDGSPNSASGLSGSPYHMRVIDWNLGNLGNQDRSLSAGAVIAPTECDLFGPQEVCLDQSPQTFTVVTDSTSVAWSIEPGPAPAYLDASIIGTSADGKTVTVATPGPNVGNFYLVVTVDQGLPTHNVCRYPVEVLANPDCLIGGNASARTNAKNVQYTAPAGMDSYFWTITGDATINGPDDGPTVSVNTGLACDGSFTLSLVVSDGVCSSECEKTVTLIDGVAPVIACPDPATLEYYQSADPQYLGYPSAEDDCDSAPTIAYADAPDLDACGLGTIVRLWTVTDASGNEITCEQTITVVDTTDPVLSDYPPNATVECDAVPEAPILTATDVGHADPVVSFKETPSLDPACGTGTITRTWTATDCAGNTEEWTQILTLVDTTDPVLSANPADATVECDAIPKPPAVTAMDNCTANPVVRFAETANLDADCGTGTITRTWTATDCAGNTDVWTQTLTVVDTTSPSLSAYPANASVECDAIPEPPVLTAQDNCTAIPLVGFKESTMLDSDCGTGTITRTWTATDCAGNTDVWTQTLTVVDTTGPVIVCPPATIVECGHAADPADTGFATADDTCSAEPVVTYADKAEVDGCGGKITRTWTATDCAGNSSSCDQVITVVDTTPPVIHAPADVRIECDQPKDQVDTGTATATDNCDSAPVIAFTDKTAVDACGYETTTRTWTATDCAGNSASAVQVIAVVDSTPPLINAPRDVILTCEDCIEENTGTSSTGVATAVDNCDGPLPVDYYDEVIGDCPSEIRRTWFATDCAGNLGTRVQRITCLSTDQVTDSSLCIFDRDKGNAFAQDFRVLFTPDTKHVPAYKISSTNPGQFFYNVFYLGDPGDEVSLEVCIPYPFVTHGATPIHAYDWVHLEECDGSVGLVPGDAFHVEKTQITLEDYLPDAGCGTGMCLMGITFKVPESGFAYLAIHLEYGPRHTGGYAQDMDGNAIDPETATPLVANHCEHVFSVGGSVTGTSSIYNLNDFKGGPGVAGTVVKAGTGEPVAGAILVLQSRDERIKLSRETDRNGSYFIPFVRKGKPAVYELWMISPSGAYESRSVLLKTNGFSTQDFTIRE